MLEEVRAYLIALIALGLVLIVGSFAVQKAGEGLGQIIHGPPAQVTNYTTNVSEDHRFSDNVVKLFSDIKIASDNTKTTKTNSDNPVTNITTTSNETIRTNTDSSTRNYEGGDISGGGLLIVLFGFAVIFGAMVSLGGNSDV